MKQITPEEADNIWSEQDLEDEPINLVEIFGSNTCSYCDKAKALCDRLGIGYRYSNIDNDEEAFDHLVSRIQKRKTVPQIFVGPIHVGGYDDFAKYIGASE